MSFTNKYCDKSFINKSAFLNFVPQVIMKIQDFIDLCVQ